jgi:hypothetical protein
MLSLLSIIVLSVVFSQSFMSVRAQSEEAIVVILPSAGGTTSPGPGTYAYPNGTNIVLSATPSSGYEFKYWIASGNYTPGHTAGQGVTIVDPETGEVIGGFPRPQFSGIDSLVFTANPANITCGYGYTYYYQAVFAPIGAPVPTSDTAIVVILPTSGGTTDPAPGTYTYAKDTTIVLKATPNTGYAFQYWIVSGNATPGHTPAQGVTIVDPETGEVIGGFPRPQFSGIDSLVFTANPANITCGYGYTYYYQAVFAPVTVASPSPEASVSPTTSPTQTISESPTTTETPNTILGVSPEVFAIIVIVVIIIIAAVIALVMRKKKT